jgi:LmbE family N-acetylglucosaminyl deacetylase
MVPSSDVSRVLAVFAHPDDESLLAGGTLAACAAAGWEVALVCASRGEQGPIASPALATRPTLGAVREAELRAAAHVLGLAAVECLGYPDGGLAWADRAGLRADLTRALRYWRPAAVITFGPEGWYWHPDHVAVHELMQEALATVEAEDLVPWVYQATWPAGRAEELVAAATARGHPASLWGLSPGAFGVAAADVTAVCDVRPFLGVKVAALRCHRSQLAPDHLLHQLPWDLTEEFLGREYFVRARRQAGRGDWLAGALRGMARVEVADSETRSEAS